MKKVNEILNDYTLYKSFKKRLDNVNDMIHGFIIAEHKGPFEGRKYPLENIKFPTALIYNNLKVKQLKAAHHSVDKIVKKLIEEYDYIWSMLDVEHNDKELYWKVLEMVSKYKRGDWLKSLERAKKFLDAEHKRQTKDVKQCINLVIRKSGGFKDRHIFLQKFTNYMNEEFNTSFIVVKGLIDYQLIDENKLNNEI